VGIENLLESYHIPSLHPKTFGNYPKEENIVHEMNDRWTSFCTNELHPWVKDGAGRTARALGLPFEGTYTQYHVYPNLVFILLGIFSLAKVVVPTSPTTSQAIIRVYAPYGPKRTPLAWISARLNAMVARHGARKILEEDASIFKDAQRGLETSEAAGVIGRREERVWAFQDWILRHCGGPERNGPVSLPIVGKTTNGVS
jgi:phenylpropionate dioxygenase-like ring-hydroxylating dioxygenase large terminal subunit